MKRLVEFSLEDGSKITMEVDGSADGSTLRSARPAEIVERARLSFEEALAGLRPAAEAIVAGLGSMIEPPEEFAVEFGLKFNAEAGAVIASVSTEANFKVVLTWKRKP